MIVSDLSFQGTDEEIRNLIIDHVCQRLVHTHTFGYYTEDDIYQECWDIALTALEDDKYDINRPLEKFLYCHIRNRLKNLYRDKCFRKKRPNESFDTWERRSKKKASLMSVAENSDESASSGDLIDEISARDLSNYIYNNLPIYLRKDYRRLLNDEPLVECTKTFIREIISEILLDA